RFQHHQDSFPQMWGNRLAGLDNERNVWLPVFVERRWHTDDHRFGFPDPGKIRGGGKATGSDGSLNLRAFNVFDVTLAAIDLVHFRRINVQAEYLDPGPRELKRQWQSDVAKSDDRDLHKLKLSKQPNASGFTREIPMSNVKREIRRFNAWAA